MRKKISESKALLKQWNYKRNTGLNPEELTQGSEKKAWWVCNKGHEWEAVINNRNTRGCPCCSGKKACSDNNLAFLNPLLAKQWHPKKNGDLSPDMVTTGSGKKVWWICDKGHEWEAVIAYRKTNNCPYCSSLAFLNPEIAKQWHPTKNGNLSPDMFTTGSDKKVWWRCDKGHEWETKIFTRKHGGCPYCSGRRVHSNNNLAFLNPLLAKQWHPTKNGDLSPDMVTTGSGKKVWWICDKGHEWETVINHRKKTGCPFCSHQSSEPEMRILTELMHIFDDARSRNKIKSLELDIYIPSFDIGIEYDGFYYHKDRVSQDKYKNKTLEKEGVRLVRVREHPLQPISPLDIIQVENKLTKETLDKIMQVLKLLVDQRHLKKINSYLLKTEYVNQALFQEYMSYFPNPFPEDSLEYLSPKLCGEWNYEKNKPLLPSNFSQSSNKKVWWKCKKGHEWEAVINNRKKTGCPYCSGRQACLENNLTLLNPSIAKQWHPKKNGDLTPEMVTLGSHKKAWWRCDKGHEWEAVIAYRKTNNCPYCSSLAFLNPEIAKQWHPTKNGDLSPDMVTTGSGKKVWWRCDKGHEWETVINYRKKGGCPYCSGRRVHSDNNLAFLNPLLAKQWHSKKNGDLTPEMVTLGSNKKVWWKCKKGHEWEAVINNRKTRGCPYCAGRKS